MNKPSLADLRENYTSSGLSKKDVHRCPFTQFDTWMQAAINATIVDANAMTLATAAADGQPSARIVLLKHYDHDGFCFFTNYDSQKGKDLTENPKAALVLHWKELERQICIRGSITKTSEAESANYFHMRPLGSQIGATASNQSQPIESRATLLTREQKLTERYAESKQVPLPKFWGGFRLSPDYIEFWQGRPSRLHDRISYQLKDSNWEINRLCP